MAAWPNARSVVAQLRAVAWWLYREHASVCINAMCADMVTCSKQRLWLQVLVSERKHGQGGWNVAFCRGSLPSLARRGHACGVQWYCNQQQSWCLVVLSPSKHIKYVFNSEPTASLLQASSAMCALKARAPTLLWSSFVVLLLRAKLSST